MRCEQCWGLTTTEQWLLWLLWAGLPDYTHIIQSSQRGAGGAQCGNTVVIAAILVTIFTRHSNEGYPKVRNHGEGPYEGLLLVERGSYRFHI